VFATLPESFFSPLASPNREHYAALLCIFYRLFQENAQGLERETVLSRFAEYLGLQADRLAREDDAGDDGEYELEEESIIPATASVPSAPADSSRLLAGLFLRKLVRHGWMGEETLPDYTRIVNISPWAKPFFEALARVEEGLRAEYESHVVAVYSLLCTDAATDNGHYAVLNAHGATTALIDSLKVLSQSIKHHYDRFSVAATDAKVADLLHLHYDVYMNEILDGAYKRLKTSDNLSRYRPRIIRRVGELLSDGAWIAGSAAKLARLGSSTVEEGRRRLEFMLQEIRDILKSLDPLLEDIDRRNMLYSRASVERVKALLEPDSTLPGKIALMAKAFHSSRSLHARLAHRLHAIRTLGPDSRYKRWLKENLQLDGSVLRRSDAADLERAEAELRLRLERQLGPRKIRDWLDGRGGVAGPIAAATLVTDTDSYIRLLYGVLYADSPHRRFEYLLEEASPGQVQAGGYLVPDLVLRRRR
jgi:hypothetical protein